MILIRDGTDRGAGAGQVGVLALDALLRALPSLSVFLRSAPFMGHGSTMHATSMKLDVRGADTCTAGFKACARLFACRHPAMCRCLKDTKVWAFGCAGPRFRRWSAL